jgi:hypothetical protein
MVRQHILHRSELNKIYIMNIFKVQKLMDYKNCKILQSRVKEKTTKYDKFKISVKNITKAAAHIIIAA